MLPPCDQEEGLCRRALFVSWERYASVGHTAPGPRAASVQRSPLQNQILGPGSPLTGKWACTRTHHIPLRNWGALQISRCLGHPWVHWSSGAAGDKEACDPPLLPGPPTSSLAQPQGSGAFPAFGDRGAAVTHLPPSWKKTQDACHTGPVRAEMSEQLALTRPSNGTEQLGEPAGVGGSAWRVGPEPLPHRSIRGTQDNWAFGSETCRKKREEEATSTLPPPPAPDTALQ